MFRMARGESIRNATVAHLYRLRRMGSGAGGEAVNTLGLVGVSLASIAYFGIVLCVVAAVMMAKEDR